jgi:hypothetical protein
MLFSCLGVLRWVELALSRLGFVGIGLCVLAGVGCGQTQDGVTTTGGIAHGGSVAASVGGSGGVGGTSEPSGGNRGGPPDSGASLDGAGAPTLENGAGFGGSSGGSNSAGSGGLTAQGGAAAEGGAGGVTLGFGNPASAGLDRHDALYCGEWQRTTKPGDTIYVLRGGKVAWTHSLSTSGGDEFGDCSMTSNGHVLFNLKNTGAQEIIPDPTTGREGVIVWRYNEDPGTEVHSVQPIGLDKVLVMQNGATPKLMLINKATAAVCVSSGPCVEKIWHPTGGGGVHGMFRHVRMAANGNIIVPYTGGGGALLGHVVEYTQDWQVVWDYDSGGSPWAAVRLKNGNTLVSGNSAGWFREVTHDTPAKVVWQLTNADFPSPMYFAQGAMRLANGNTVVASWCGSLTDVSTWPNAVQYWEVTPDKKFVWTVKSWTNPNLGPGSYLQLLDEPGVPESPGELQR